jgi:ankyrin repeat protein
MRVDLIYYIRQGQYTRAASLLNDGADPNAREAANLHVTYKQLLVNLIARHSDHADGLTALQLLFEPERDNDNSLKRGVVSNSRFEVLRLLLSHGANVHVRDDSYLYGLNTPVAAYPARYGYANCVELLLRAGEDSNACNEEGETLLMFALDPYCKPGSWKAPVVKVLLDHGADPKQRNQSGGSAYDYANEQGDTTSMALIRNVIAKQRK